MSNTHLDVEVAGMSCSHCVQSVKTALEKLDGVSSVEVSLEKGQASIAGDNLLPDSINKAIEDLGFTPGKIDISSSKA